jgi:hypothetical protein
MLKTVPDPQSIVLSVQLYRMLITAYPAMFRREYGEPMVQAFRDSARQASREGSLLALWARVLIDTFKTVVEEHIRGGVYMTREKLIRLCGWGMILGSLLIFVGWMAESRPVYDQYNLRSLPIDRYANMAAVPLISMGIALTSLGTLGLLARYGRQAGSFGRLSLGFSIFSGLVSALGAAGLAFSDSNPSWSMFFFGWGFQSLFLALFGIASLRLRLLPRWNGLPLLTGIWVPAFMLISMVYEQATGAWLDLPEAIFIALFLVLGAGLAGIGYLLQSQVSADSAASGAV